MIKTLIIKSPTGQLGNRLCIFAHFIAYAIHKDYRLVNLAFREYQDHFKSTKKRLICSYPAGYNIMPKTNSTIFLYRMLHKIIERTKLAVSIEAKLITKPMLESQEYNLETEELENLRRQINFIYFSGWRFRCNQLVKRYDNEIRSFFEPVDENKKKIKSLLELSKTKGNMVVGVHIRRGDLKFFNNGQYFFTNDQYITLMKNVEKIFSNETIVFLICSDEKQKQDYFKELNTVIAGGNLVEDMYALSECDYIIGPPSTFTTWASFYGKTPLYRVFKPSDSFGREHFMVYIPGGMSAKPMDEIII